MNRVYFRDRYPYLQALEIFSRTSHSITDRALGQQVIGMIARAMRVSHAYLLLPDFSQDNFVMRFTNNGFPLAETVLDTRSPLMKHLARLGNPVSRHELELMPQFIGREKAILGSLGTELMIPGKTSTGNFAGLVLLGEKLNHQPYTGEEKRIIQTFIDQIATKLDNNRLYSEATKMRQELQELSNRLVQAQEGERREIARELHDEIGQSLAITKILIDGSLKSRIFKDEKLIQAQSTIKEIIEQVRELSLNLRPSVLDDLGLLPALEWFIERYSKSTGIKVAFKRGIPDLSCNSNFKITIYRIIQESLNNIAKHAKTNEAQIVIAVKNGKLDIEISDNGIGFNPTSAVPNLEGSLSERAVYTTFS